MYWTLVQGILAPLQFLVFLVSLGLVVRYLWTGAGYEAATVSIVVKTGFVLYVIMITGAIWGKGRVRQVPLRARLLLGRRLQLRRDRAAHRLSLGAFTGALTADGAHAPRAGRLCRLRRQRRQFLWKLRMARLQAADAKSPGSRA
jgi:3-vinyl bacteriochlorophyllide hydratase